MQSIVYKVSRGAEVYWGGGEPPNPSLVLVEHYYNYYIIIVSHNNNNIITLPNNNNLILVQKNNSIRHSLGIRLAGKSTRNSLAPKMNVKRNQLCISIIYLCFDSIYIIQYDKYSPLYEFILFFSSKLVIV